MKQLPDSPDIREIEATGYWRSPYEPLGVVCADCEATMAGDLDVYEYDGDYLCEECFVDRIRDLTPFELADVVGARLSSASDLAIKR